MGTEQDNAISEQLSRMTDEELEQLQDDIEDDKEDDLLENLENNYGLTQEVQDGYSERDKDEKQNAHSFLHKATFENKDTIRTTYLKDHELGKPHFNVRTLMDLESISKYYLDPIIISLLKLSPNSHNGIANYFKAKRSNITDSGMSNDGFSMKLNVTQKRDTTKQRVLPPQEFKRRHK